MRGFAPSSRSARTSRPLVALLKWLTTCRRPATSCSTRTVATRGARSAGGRQNAAYVVERRSTSSPLPTVPATAGPRVVAPHAGHRAEAGQGGVAGEAVGRDPVARAQQSEEAADDRDPRRGPALRRRPRGRRGPAPRRARRCRRRPHGRWAPCRDRRSGPPGRAASVARRAPRRPGPGRRHTGRRAPPAPGRGPGSARASPASSTSSGRPRRGAALPSLGRQQDQHGH